jgi:hypothetical protein
MTDLEQARPRLVAAAHSTDHLLIRHADAPYVCTSARWLELLADEARQLVKAVNEYLGAEPTTLAPSGIRGITDNSEP